MARLTPHSMRNRTSDISLRGAAHPSSQPSSASPATASDDPSAYPKFKSSSDLLKDRNADGFLAFGSERENLQFIKDICGTCVEHLPDGKILQVSPYADGRECRMCKLRAAKPEAFTQPFCDFLTENPTVFHAVDYFKRAAFATGYKELAARDNWIDKIEPGGKYLVTRNGSALIAFEVGEAYKPGNGFAMVAAHIDALTAKLKPVSNKPDSMGFQRLGVAPYAGALNETWWDRDLSIGGRVVVRDAEKGKTRTQLVKLDWPIARIPTLAPHFGVGMMGDKNKETQVVPIIGLETSASSDTASAPANPGLAKTFIASQPPKLVALIASQLKIQDHSSIVNWELELYDSQPAQVGGMDKEFIFAGRIDDKLCSWAAYMALLLADRSKDDGTVRMVALFDDEEIGSLLRQGAKGNFMSSVIDRVVESLTAHASSKAASAQPAFCTASGISSKPTPPPPTFGPGLVGQTLASSFLLSADVTHAINPNFISVHETAHAPRLNVGVALCADSNGHMTTDSISTAILQRIADNSDCTLQRFIIRNDMRSGGTVGPGLSSALGVKAADAGIPQLSMHSIRATTGSLDPGLGVKFFKAFLEKYEEVDGEWR